MNLPYDGGQIPPDALVCTRLIQRNHYAIVLDIEREEGREPPRDPTAPRPPPISLGSEASSNDLLGALRSLFDIVICPQPFR